MIQVLDLYKEYGNATIFDGASFVVSGKQTVGVVGPNGAGKTTLLKIILGEEEYDKGKVVIDKKDVLGYLPQKIDFIEGETVRGYLEKTIRNWEHFKVDDVLMRVGLGGIDRTTLVAKISGGQKTRLAIATLLLKQPTILLLDEPTNNLDIQGLEWFEEFVKHFDGIVLVVSHDRAFLDNTVEKIIELDPFVHKINEYTGGYSDFIVARHARLERELEEYEHFESKRKKMEEWIALKRQQLSIYVNPKVGRQLQAMKTRYQREIVDNQVLRPTDYKKIKISSLGNAMHSSKLMFRIDDACYPNIVCCNDLSIFANDRIHLKGSNGSGKTTFIKMLLGLLKNFTGIVKRGEDVKIGYFAQEHDTLQNPKTVLAEFMDKVQNVTEPEARRILGKFLFVGDTVFKKVSSLSQGEQVKLIIGELVYQKNNFLILDEPTNHLDLESREVLEYALSRYEGGLLVVSHDRYFIHQIGINREFEVHEGMIEETFA